jgi:hypothetical protein
MCFDSHRSRRSSSIASWMIGVLALVDKLLTIDSRCKQDLRNEV